MVPGLLAGNHLLVEAGGQHIHGFRRGLDYAFILSPGCGACYSLLFQRILVFAHRFPEQRTYESLQGRPEVGPLPTPRRCHSASLAVSGFADVSPVFTLPLRADATN